VIVFFGHFSNIMYACKYSNVLHRQPFSPRKKFCIRFDKKRVWAAFRLFLSQTRLAALLLLNSKKNMEDDLLACNDVHTYVRVCGLRHDIAVTQNKRQL
jgi:hypothetical protein